jgi:hypothetical protein
MYINSDTKHKVKSLKAGDPNWHIHNGLTITPRAGFEISNQCPREYRLILADCIDRGWLKPVAYMRDDEYMWEELKK